MTKQELAAKIWATSNELRKNIRASEFKDYILGFMFWKYLCDKEIDYIKDLGGEEDDLLDVDEDIKTKLKDGIGYYISHNHLFSTWRKAGVNLGAKDVVEAIDDFYENLNMKYESFFKNIFSVLQGGLSKLGENAGSRDKAVRDIVDLIAFIPPTSRDYDVLGYIYEYLIKQFSNEAKRDGAFYTPKNLSLLGSLIIKERLKDRDEILLHDPCVGSAGLMLTLGKAAEKYISADKIKYYGQDLITETANLAKMNLFMQGIPVQNINIRNANTLEEDWPYFDEQTSYAPLFVDACSLNPPYSVRHDFSGYENDERYKGYGLPPDGKADYAFLLHSLYHIKNDGIMTIILPHGVLFRGDSEGEIRKNLILRHNIETIISMPANLFTSTPIAVILMVLSKNREADDILFIDASQSFKKDKTQNVLRDSDVKRIFDAVMQRKDIDHFAHLASLDEIKKNDYNLNVPRYVSAKKDEAPYDLFSVMTGKVSEGELERFKKTWERFPALKDKLLERTEGYYAFKDIDCRKTVSEDPDVVRFLSEFENISDAMKGFLRSILIDTDNGPEINYEIEEKIFELFGGYPLVDVYNIYQAFCDNWVSVDLDLARINQEGKQICIETEPLMVVKKDSKTKETREEQAGWKGKIIPFELVKKAFFAEDLAKASKLLSDADSKASEYDEKWESLDEEIKANLAKDDDTVFDAKKIKDAIKGKAYDADVLSILKSITALIDEEKALRKEAKNLEAELEKKAKDKIPALSQEDVNALIEQKWINPIIDAVNSVGSSVITQFISDFEALEKKYAYPLSNLSEEIEKTSSALKASLSDLTGNETDMAALKMLMEEL